MELASYAILTLVVLAALAGLVRPGIGAALGLLVFAIEQGLSSGISYFVDHPAIWNQSSAAIAGTLLVSAILRGRYRLRGFVRPVFVSAILFFCYFIWACSWGPYMDAWQWAVNMAPYAVIQLVLVPLLIQSEADARAMLHWLIVFGVSIGVVALLQVERADTVQRLQFGTAGSPDVAMNPMALSEACALAAAVLALLPRDGTPGWLRLGRWPLIVACLVVAGLASRGEVFAVIVGIGLAMILMPEGGLGRGSVRLVATVLLGGLSLYFVLSTGVSARYSAERLEGDAQIRYLASSTMLNRFFESPENWFRGLGTNYSKMLIGIYPHNQPIQALTEGGFLGAGLWLSVHGFAFRAHLKTRHSCRAPSERFVLRAATAIWLYFVVVGLKRGHVLDIWAISAAVILERCAMALTDGRPSSGHVVEEGVADPVVQAGGVSATRQLERLKPFGARL